MWFISGSQVHSVLYLAEPGSALGCHDLTYHRLLLTGLNASDFTGLNAQNLQLGLGWDGMQIYERNSTMSTALQCQKKLSSQVSENNNLIYKKKNDRPGDDCTLRSV